ncbi:Myomegalin, partial [Opisthocomus hoazin]
GRGVSRILAQHLRDALQSFEELLRGTDIDYYLGQGFREQLAQSRQLAKRLSDKLGITPVKGHLRRLRQELQEKEKVIESLEAKLQERCESPGSSRPPSESSRSATSTSFVRSLPDLRVLGGARGGPCSPSAASGLSQSHANISLHLSLLSPGLHFDSLSNPVSAPLPALSPGLPPFLPAGPPLPTATLLLGCCGTPICSLAEVQQELQVLQRQLGESE